MSLNVFLASLWGVFVLNHVLAFGLSGNYAFIAFAFSETLQAFFFMVRQSPHTVSVDPFDWLIAGGGTLAPLFLRPGGGVLLSSGELLVIIAVAFQIVGLLSLNRSFALVAARRTVKTSGLYRFVRHPMYASYLFLFGGYLMFNASLMNALLIAFTLTLLFLRLLQEEKHLVQDPAYREYMSRTPWRLIPFVY
jgi:protein-S-isoprenylcysteine O-methyltransferase Ste14